MSAKLILLQQGLERVDAFCKLNHILPPKHNVMENKSPVNACAYWRDGTTTIYPASCASAASEGQVRNYNWPGYTVDRTPYGVVCHELGHHVDFHCGKPNGRYSSDYSIKMARTTGEKPLTSYAPNEAEWFAEMFRLFVTNPLLLKAVRPKTFAALKSDGHRWFRKPWRSVLIDAPPKIIRAAENKIGRDK